MHRFEQVFPMWRLGSLLYTRHIRSCGIAVLLLILALATAYGQTQQSTTKAVAPVPQPAISAILAAFDRYEIVAMPQGHGMQDLNDFILSLIRNPAFSEKVNDIEVEFGNSLYQPMLDR